MAEDACDDPTHPKTLLVASSLTDPVALGQKLGSDYLPLGHAWELQLNSVKFARVTEASAGTRVVEPLVTKCELLLDGTNTVFCRCLQDYPELPNPIYRALHDYARKVSAAG
jgi:hypothetical protein